MPPRSDGLEGVGLLDGCAVLCVVVDFDEKINFCFVNVVGSRMGGSKRSDDLMVTAFCFRSFEMMSVCRLHAEESHRRGAQGLAGYAGWTGGFLSSIICLLLRAAHVYDLHLLHSTHINVQQLKDTQHKREADACNTTAPDHSADHRHQVQELRHPNHTNQTAELSNSFFGHSHWSWQDP